MIIKGFSDVDRKMVGMLPRSLRMELHYVLILAAIECVLSFSWFGFINFSMISSTTMHIPVLLAAIFLGRWAGCGMGAVFGLLSMWKASNAGFVPGDIAFAPFLSGNPCGSLLAGLGARMLFGFLAGWTYEILRAKRAPWLVVFISTYFLTWLHTFFVLGSLGLFFPALGLNAWIAMQWMFSAKNFFSGGMAMLLVPTFYYWCWNTRRGRRFLRVFMQVENTTFYNGNLRLLLFFMGAMTIIATGIVVYFIQHIEALLNFRHCPITAEIDATIWGWGIQFVLAIAAVAFLLFVIFVYFYNMTAKAMRKSKLDSLTKLYNKESVSHQVNRLLEEQLPERCGAFLMLDIDRFKAVNDLFGHPKGDEVLCEVAHALRHAVRARDIIGRIGGDEFCVCLLETAERESVRSVVDRIVEGIHQICLPDGQRLTCSMGVVCYAGQKNFAEFYAAADQALYCSKQKGRDCYSFFSVVEKQGKK